MEEKPRPLRLGVIGAGWFASRRHCPDVVDHPEVELAALCRRDEKQLAQMARAFDVADTYHVVEAQLPPPPTPVDNLVDCARGRGLPELDGETAVHIIEILDAAYCSARGGHKVSL
jgi:predicted dehydrogenase